MVSFFSHGFASGGSSSTKQEKKKSKGEWVPIMDGLGRTINWQHSETGFYYYAPLHPAQMQQHMVGGGFVVQPGSQQVFQPVAQVYHPAMAWGANGMLMPPVKSKKEKEKENEGGYWESLRDHNGVRYYKNSRTHKITYFDPLK